MSWKATCKSRRLWSPGLILVVMVGSAIEHMQATRDGGPVDAIIGFVNVFDNPTCESAVDFSSLQQKVTVDDSEVTVKLTVGNGLIGVNYTKVSVTLTVGGASTFTTLFNFPLSTVSELSGEKVTIPSGTAKTAIVMVELFAINPATGNEEAVCNLKDQTEIPHPAVDLEAIDLRLKKTTAGEKFKFDVTPVIRLSSDGEFNQLPVDYQLFIDGNLVADSRTHMFKFTGECKLPECTGTCKLEETTKDATFESECEFIDGKCGWSIDVELWEVKGVPIPPRATCLLVLDPDNIVAEPDEGNNELIVQGVGHPIHVPFIDAWGILVLTMTLLGTSVVLIRRAG